MARTSSRPFPEVRRLLGELGANVKLARQRRRLTAQLVAERAGMTRPTLRSIERGEPGVTLGALANVLQALGLEHDLALIARADELGRKLEDARLEARGRVAPQRNREG